MAEPYCLAMVLCDAVHQDRATNKFTILGTFSTRREQFPLHFAAMIYFAITDGSGEVMLSVRIVESAADITDEDGVVVFESPRIPIHLPSPLMVMEGVIPLIGQDERGMIQPVSLPRPGVYHCELRANDQLLMARRLLALGPPDERQHEQQS